VATATDEAVAGPTGVAAPGPAGPPGDGAPTWIGVAIDIPEPWGSLLTRCRAQTVSPPGPCPPAHLTLLGPTEIPADRLPEVEAHLTAVAAAHPPYHIQLRGTGTFRPVTEVVFVAVAAGISECEQLAAAIGQAEVLRREARFPYHPHVTVAQDAPTEVLDQVYEELVDFSARFEVDRFTLFSHSGDVRWRPLRDFQLIG